MGSAGCLIVLRGNSGSGKSTVARLVQQRFSGGRCAVIAQDQVRRDVLREDDIVGGFNVELIELMADACLQRGLVVLIEGILDVDRYQQMLAGVAAAAGAAHFFAWDLGFDETVRRHGQRLQRGEFTSNQMERWYHGWQPLEFVTETRLDESISAEQATETILAHIGVDHRG